MRTVINIHVTPAPITPGAFANELFYAVRWFQLTPAQFLSIVQPEGGLDSLLNLVRALRLANPGETNAPIEKWCNTPHPSLSLFDQTPAKFVQVGALATVMEALQAKGPEAEPERIEETPSTYTC